MFTGRRRPTAALHLFLSVREPVFQAEPGHLRTEAARCARELMAARVTAGKKPNQASRSRATPESSFSSCHLKRRSTRTERARIAAASTPATVEAGKGAVAIPPIAGVDAIRISPIDEAKTQPPGRENHRCRRSRFVRVVASLLGDVGNKRVSNRV